MGATVPATGHHRATAQAERIARLFAEGHDLTTVAQQGQVNGWTRGRALEVVSQRGWTLDSSGRVPRHQRPAVTPGKPLPSVPAGMPGVGTIGGERPVVAAPAPSPGRAQVASLADRVEAALTALPRPAAPEPKPAAKAAARAAALGESAGNSQPTAESRSESATNEPDLPALTGMATAAQQRERGSADTLLAKATASAHPAVAVAVAKARLALDEVRHALDVIDAERQRLTELDAEAARLCAHLAELDTERARLLTGDTPRLPADTPPPAAPATAPHGEPAPAGPTPPTKATMAAGDIDHGTWGGFLKHRYRGETAEQIQTGCPDCYATKAGRGRKATP